MKDSLALIALGAVIFLVIVLIVLLICLSNAQAQALIAQVI